MLGKGIFVVLSCSLLLNPLTTYAKIILVLGKREVYLTVPPMENLFAMMELLVNPKNLY